MKIDINKSPPTLDNINEARKKRARVQWLSLFVSAIGIGYTYYWHQVNNELLVVPVVLSSIIGLFFLLSFIDYIVHLPYSPIDDAECAVVLRLVTESDIVRQYVEQVKAQQRELVGVESIAFYNQVNLEANTQNKRALYSATVTHE